MTLVRPSPQLSPPGATSPTDQVVAEATIPRGADRADTGTAPAVDEPTWLLHVRYRRTGDPHVLEELVEEYHAYALALARRLHRDGEPIDDLRQVALESLITSLQRFDPERGVPFVAYATPTIVGAIKRYYRDQGWALRVPRVAHDLAGPARDTADRLAGELGRAPTVTEVAQALSVSEEDLILAQSATRARSMVSLDAPRPGSDGERTVEVGEVDTSFALTEGRVALEAAMGELGSRDRTVLGLYFFESLTQVQIAERYGVSQMQVSRWISSSLARLRARMGADAPAPSPTARQARSA
ncbi:sigma-70 family RNA polymerase sigma factor [Iamia sp. SCSIO 61187]|uniref:sigma-70 family RNA polymerase sigma factor n=1 Tax=Iamia sp. SCSIO 61187 TaxID=2722752 RepID=UPI001C62FBF8|nr:sigma-70 family RNA polymerase sigma factor [Iamia sp. SCSIO 61187]QYG91875.1 sigma-70 family RNA polymerase sigma factor [Iamia sp. SCSIO 61187]